MFEKQSNTIFQKWFKILDKHSSKINTKISNLLFSVMFLLNYNFNDQYLLCILYFPEGKLLFIYLRYFIGNSLIWSFSTPRGNASRLILLSTCALRLNPKCLESANVMMAKKKQQYDRLKQHCGYLRNRKTMHSK